MALIYKVKQASRATKEGKKLYHPSIISMGIVTTAQLAKEIAEYSSLTAGDVKSTIDNLITVMRKHLVTSEVVELDGIGTFRIRLRSQGNGAETPDEVFPQQSVPRLYFRTAAKRSTTRSTALWALLENLRYRHIDQLQGSTTPQAFSESDREKKEEANQDF